MTFEEYCDIYFKKKTIDLRTAFNQKELDTIQKLEVKIDNRFYTVREYIDLKKYLGIFCNSSNNEELKYLKPSKYNVSKSEFNQLCNKFNEIDIQYKELLRDFRGKIFFEDIWHEEKVHIRDKLINILNQGILNDFQKQQLLEIIMNIKSATLISKHRFIIYYGLDKKNEKIHSYSKIAKLEGCSASNIRQSINHIKAKLLRLSNEEIEILRTIVNKQ